MISQHLLIKFLYTTLPLSEIVLHFSFSNSTNRYQHKEYYFNVIHFIFRVFPWVPWPYFEIGSSN